MLAWSIIKMNTTGVKQFSGTSWLLGFVLSADNGHVGKVSLTVT